MGFLSRKQDLTESTTPSEPRQAPRKRNPSGSADAGGLDPTDTLKRRARRRLLGASALAVGAIVFVPMLFDNGGPPAADQLSVQIPAKDTPFQPVQKADPVPAPNGAGPVAAAGTAPSAGTANPGAAQPPAAAPPSVAPTAASASVPSPAAGAQPAPSKALAAAKNPPSAEAAAAGARAPLAKPSGPEVDDPRALAALEGKTLDPTPVRQGATTASGFVVQVGAFASPEKVQEVRDKLAAAGVKSYTENLSTAQGSRTRVRIGPFTSYDAAAKALERLKGVGLDGAVVAL